MCMRWLVAAALTAGLAAPASAQQQANQVTRQQIERLTAAFVDSWAKQDAGAIAGLFTEDGVLVSQSPPKAFKIGRAEIKQVYENVFKGGRGHLEVNIEQLLPFGRDAVIELSEYRVTVQGQSGPISLVGHASALDVRQGGTWKIRMLAAVPDAAASGK